MAGYYHLSVGIIGRGTGRSAVACAAYRSGELLVDERYGKVQDYERRRGIAETGIVVPAGAPEWMSDREELWNAVERGEKRKDAQLSREFELGFPHQLNADQRHELLQEFISQEITSKGLVADWSIHAPNRAGDARNWHAHVMTTLRAANDNGFEKNKDRSLNTPEQLTAWRAAWEVIQNKTFERYRVQGDDGQILKVDHRSYEAQGQEQEPTVHLGVHATAMERRGEETELGDLNRSIRKANLARLAVRRQAVELTRQEIFLKMAMPHVVTALPRRAAEMTSADFAKGLQRPSPSEPVRRIAAHMTPQQAAEALSTPAKAGTWEELLVERRKHERSEQAQSTDRAREHDLEPEP